MQSVPAKRLATRLRQFMKDTGTTQNQAAAALHMSQSAFSRRYLGHVELRASEVAALASLLGIEVTDLYGDSAVSA
ncbi:helix-turn-helix domain-containing protein [Mycolicibacterium mucogenicum]|uniref:XRE family transcriptional regulator n=2 Tax=Mycolicibacterium mucogenicum DSM 44124 TaxID=1226753 RepID=A0A8H2JAS9_MYCMU|nr:helix-turn-helix transcriptional regulator [Mycolicibacterium mucogenicum]